MRARALFVAAALATASAGAPVVLAAPPERVWLVVVASDSSAEGIAQRAKGAASALPDPLVVQTRDCGAARSVFALAAVAASVEAAQALLPRARGVAADAFVKRCEVAPGSLLALRISAIHPSIYDVPEDAVNWGDEDRITTLVPLGAGRGVVVQRYFVNDPEDPLEGRRERVLLPGSAAPQVLENDCPSAGGFRARDGRLAFECAREQAADALLHEVLVFSPAGALLARVSRCRTPRWLSSDTVACEAESVAADGRLSLREKRTRLPGAEVGPARR